MIDTPPRLIGRATLVALLLVSLLAPAAALGAPRPGESCPDTTAAPGTSLPVCGEGNGPGDDPAGGGSIDLAALGPILVAAGGGAVIALAAAFLFFRRRAAGPIAAADPGEWWTCRNCGSNNVIGSPRCYACGEWQA
jgi:hypothetical protein